MQLKHFLESVYQVIGVNLYPEQGTGRRIYKVLQMGMFFQINLQIGFPLIGIQFLGFSGCGDGHGTVKINRLVGAVVYEHGHPGIRRDIFVFSGCAGGCKEKRF